MSQTDPKVHLKRAAGLIDQVGNSIEDFRQRAIAYDASADNNQPLLAYMVSSATDARQLNKKKAALVGDLQLADREIDAAERTDAEAVIEWEGVVLGVQQLRALSLCASGQLEMLWGKGGEAKAKLLRSVAICEGPDAHFMLGLVFESEGQPSSALEHFEKCLELDPDGELSIPALRESNAMRNYSKRFRGSWPLLVILCLLPPIPFMWGLIYFFAKRK